MNYVVNVARDRYISLTKYSKRGQYKRINKLINVLLSLVPDEFNIQGVLIQGGVSDRP